MRIAFGAVAITATLALSACAGLQRTKEQKLAAEKAIQAAELEIRSVRSEAGAAALSLLRGAEFDLSTAKAQFAVKQYLQARESAERSVRVAKQAREAAVEAKRKEAEEQRKKAEQARAGQQAPSKDKAAPKKKTK